MSTSSSVVTSDDTSSSESDECSPNSSSNDSVDSQDSREIDALNKRLGLLIKTHISDHVGVESTIPKQTRVIQEAAPTDIHTVKLSSDKWRFNGSIPDSLQDVPDRLWYVKHEMRLNTHINDHLQEKQGVEVLPPGFHLWDSTPSCKTSLEAAKHELASLFEREINKPEADRIPFGDDRALHGHYLIFGTPVGVKILYNDAIQVLDKKAPNVASMCREYYNMISRIYGQDQQTLATKTQLILMRYEPKAGIWLHIDNVARYDRGPICTISVGPAQAKYDLCPTLMPDGSPVRVSFKEGQMITMDGVARMKWGHGIPLQSHNEYKYTMMFKMDKISDNVVGHVALLGTDIYQTPLDPLQTSVIPERHMLGFVRGWSSQNPLGQKLELLHNKIQTLESHFITRKHK